MLPPGRTYPGQKHQNTSREVHFSQLLAQLILVILSRFPRFCKSYVLITFSFPRDVLPSYLHQAATDMKLLQFLCNFISTFVRHLRTPLPQTFDLTLPGTTFSRIDITIFWGAQTTKISSLGKLKKSSHYASRGVHSPSTATTTVLCRTGLRKLPRSLWPSDHNINGHDCSQVSSRTCPAS